MKGATVSFHPVLDPWKPAAALGRGTGSCQIGQLRVCLIIKHRPVSGIPLCASPSPTLPGLSQPHSLAKGLERLPRRCYPNIPNKETGRGQGIPESLQGCQASPSPASFQAAPGLHALLVDSQRPLQMPRFPELLPQLL